MSERTLEGRVALVTGAASGMGKAHAERLAAAGAHVAATDLNLEALQGVVDGIIAAGGSAKAFMLDVADGAAIARTVPQIAAEWGRLDILVNNAGISLWSPVDGPDYETNWGRLMDVLVTSHQRAIRAALPFLRQSDAARIVNIASTEALGGTAGNSAYSAAKAAVTGLTRTLAVELGKEGITVNCVCPGPILTGMTDKVPEADQLLYARRRTALRRYGRPEEVAHVVYSLCVPDASYMTGAVIPVDGGLMARNA